MHIALVKGRYSLRHGGSERYCVNLSRQLKKRGHDVSVIGHTIDEELQDEVEFIPVRRNMMMSSTKNRSFAENCGKEVKKRKFDLVYGIGRAFGLDAVRVTERLQSHWLRVNYKPQWRYQMQTWNPRHRTLVEMERQIYQSSDTKRIITQSQLDRRLVMENYGISEEKIRIVYNGVDLGQFNLAQRDSRDEIREELALSSDQKLMVFASMDFPGKGLRYIIESLSRMQEDNVVLAVLGKGPIPQYQAIAKEFHVQERVQFLGRRSDIQRFYGAGDLFILPTAYEPFPNVNLEAMACGLPVLTTSTSGGADIIREQENGYLISAIDAVEEMIELLDTHFKKSDSELDAMRANCWATAEQMPIEKNVERTLEVFEEVLHEKFRV
ncbi:Lipopolysaccharide core biosynthesis protein RfaG [Polystyrenella longa]|uniref:Lipopolysaccharide core biosynthesis protein RfaG n=1 Tax=Polystyrenella longa TaxID=2528007 RepID=A0A518CPR1_9PLAN|nr:glycosyltransferase family 4 protein [Polystyrenella longa]QDU81215.1 Lipopolysaccharide core biosynthesis protein RfaG [Polystyrenella longa]